jgi:hypothetical protein
MSDKDAIKVGIGFATGRKSFRKVLKTYIYNWLESGFPEEENVQLKLFVAYDLKYSNTKLSDYTDLDKEILELIDESYFIGGTKLKRVVDELISNQVINEKEARLFFGNGYAAKRNSILYAALKNDIDYLVFLDDDEYPLAVTNTKSNIVWGGQHVISTHLRHIKNADITNGYHCGYVSPIPYIKYNEIMTETDFKLFIEAISNDIINWEDLTRVMNNGGVTYADTRVLTSDKAEEVEEVNHTKFISGSNLCINLTNPNRVNPFYNPPGARGEDTFLSTCLTQCKVLRIPCYTFHDGFSTYQHIMNGVLPIRLKYIQADSEQIIQRFYKACIGWIRYKPLLLYITQRDNYSEKITQIRENLQLTLSKICAYFKNNDFNNVLKELESYNRNVDRHYEQFMEVRNIWKKLIANGI